MSNFNYLIDWLVFSSEDRFGEVYILYSSRNSSSIISKMETCVIIIWKQIAEAQIQSLKMALSKIPNGVNLQEYLKVRRVSTEIQLNITSTVARRH